MLEKHAGSYQSTERFSGCWLAGLLGEYDNGKFIAMLSEDVRMSVGGRFD